MLQLYMIRDRDFMRDLLARARRTGRGCAGADGRPGGAERALLRRQVGAGRGPEEASTRSCVVSRRSRSGPAGRGDVGVRGGPHTLGNFGAGDEGRGRAHPVPRLGRPQFRCARSPGRISTGSASTGAGG